MKKHESHNNILEIATANPDNIETMKIGPPKLIGNTSNNLKV